MENDMKKRMNQMGKALAVVAVVVATQVPARADGISEAVGEFTALGTAIAGGAAGVIAIRLAFVGIKLGKKLLGMAS